MAPTRTTCPRCRQPIVADLQQLFDTNSDPQAKQKLLSGQMNAARCSSCGFEGALATPIIYHDAEKELLLTFFPPELNMPVNEQERLVGPLITQVVNHLPNEKRKAYLFTPQTMLTMQGLVEKILEKDGITKEMLQEQQQKINLLRDLTTATTPEDRRKLINEKMNLVDESFFALFSRIIESALASNDENTVKGLAEIQKQLLEETETGRKLQSDAKEAETAVQRLQAVSKEGLTREKLLELISSPQSKVQLATLVRLTRSGMDYQFFQLLSARIDSSPVEEKQRLLDLREDLLTMTSELDKEVAAQIDQYNKLIEKMLTTPDVARATEQILPAVTELFMEVLQSHLKTARQSNDLDRITKLNQIVGVIEKASAPPPEIEFIEQLMQAKDESEMVSMMENSPEKITPEFMQTAAGLAAQASQQPGAEQAVAQLEAVHRSALRFSMKRNLA